MVYYNYDTDSLENKGMKTYTYNTTLDSDGEDIEKVIVHSSRGRRPRNFSWSEDVDGDKNTKSIVMITDGKTTKLNFTQPSPEEMKMLEKVGFAKESKEKLHVEEMMMLDSKSTKYKVTIEEKETGKVKVKFADDKGKTIKTDEFDHAKGISEREIEIKDLKSGIYFVQVQLNEKTSTSKLEIKLEE
jgi:hypothetical protein